MKDSERAKTYLRDLFTWTEGGHAYEPGSYMRANKDVTHVADLMDLLTEVREDERRKQLRTEHTDPGDDLESAIELGGL